MKKQFLLLISILVLSCSKNDDSAISNPITPAAVTSKTVIATGFNYKEFYQETANSSTRKGLIILAVGDGSTENDGTLNEQCIALAQEGYVAITTSYRSLNGTWEQQGASFKADIENVITNTGTWYNIPRSKTILGGLSRGGNMTMALILPNGQFATATSFTGIKGAIFQCSGGDNWKGSAVLFPVAWMSNNVDATMGVTNANEFKTGLQSNVNTDVKTLSECLIYNSSGHCGDISGNKAFIVRKVKEWLP